MPYLMGSERDWLGESNDEPKRVEGEFFISYHGREFLIDFSDSRGEFDGDYHNIFWYNPNETIYFDVRHGSRDYVRLKRFCPELFKIIENKITEEVS